MPRLLSKKGTRFLIFLAITYPSIRRIFNLEHLQVDDRMVEILTTTYGIQYVLDTNIWHFMRTWLSEKTNMFLIGSSRKRDTRLKFANAMHTLSTNEFQL